MSIQFIEFLLIFILSNSLVDSINDKNTFFAFRSSSLEKLPLCSLNIIRDDKIRDFFFLPLMVLATEQPPLNSNIISLIISQKVILMLNGVVLNRNASSNKIVGIGVNDEAMKLSNPNFAYDNMNVFISKSFSLVVFTFLDLDEAFIFYSNTYETLKLYDLQPIDFPNTITIFYPEEKIGDFIDLATLDGKRFHNPFFNYHSYSIFVKSEKFDLNYPNIIVGLTRANTATILWRNYISVKPAHHLYDFDRLFSLRYDYMNQYYKDNSATASDYYVYQMGSTKLLDTNFKKKSISNDRYLVLIQEDNAIGYYYVKKYPIKRFRKIKTRKPMFRDNYY